MVTYKMPKLKVKISKFELEEKRKKKRNRILISLSAVVMLLIICSSVYYINNLRLEGKIIANKTEIASIDVSSYDKDNNEINVSLKPSNEQKACTFSEEKVDKDTLQFNELNDGYCNINVPFNAVYIYFQNKNGVVSDPIELNNYVVDFNVDEKYYFALNSEKSLLDDIVVIGSPTIDIESTSDAVSLKDFKFTSSSNGKTILKIKNGTLQEKDIEVVVTDTIIEMPKEFDYKKEFLGCEVYSDEENDLLDEILAYRIEQAGYGTRAGAVAAARFLTLEFPYRISYYFENGRLNGTGTHYVDGEGRYYHKGLYLSKSKYDELVPGATFSGPKMWGCKMVNHDSDPSNGYIPGKLMPNGLDCSGFVSWALYNGGQDVGDGGAGESTAPKQMTDTGEFKRLTQSMIDNGEVKVGDLLNIYGHIAMLAGDDGENYYVAESLNSYKGVVLKKYSKKTVIKSFPYVVLMDSVYNGDGNLTNMWY